MFEIVKALFDVVHDRHEAFLNFKDKPYTELLEELDNITDRNLGKYYFHGDCGIVRADVVGDEFEYMCELASKITTVLRSIEDEICNIQDEAYANTRESDDMLSEETCMECGMDAGYDLLEVVAYRNIIEVVRLMTTHEVSNLPYIDHEMKAKYIDKEC